MKEEYINITKSALFTILGVLAIFLVSFSMSPQEQISYETNYEGLALMGLAPNAPMRPPTQVDINTGVFFTNDKEYYLLFESRNWNTLDYGKTFVWRVK